MNIVLMPLAHGAVGYLDELLGCVFFLSFVLVIFFVRAERVNPRSPTAGTKPHRRWIMLGAACCAALVGVWAIWQSQVSQAQSVAPPGSNLYVPDADRAVPNPLPVTIAYSRAGQQIYAQNCAVCHGATGKGNGPLAATLDPRPVDLTVHALLHTEGELYYWVTNGITGSAMSGWQAQLTDTERWQLVEFLRALPAMTPAPQP